MSTIPKALEQALQRTQENLAQTEQRLLQTQQDFHELKEAVAKHFAEVASTQSDKTPSVWQNFLNKTGIGGVVGEPLNQLVTKAVHSSVTEVPTNSSEVDKDGTDIPASTKSVAVAANMLTQAKQVIIIPGYGMAVAQAHHKIWELTQALDKRGVTVKFALHPVAGRMPGHMDVLLAEAGIPYAIIFDLEEINAEFAQTNVALVIGANDVINPAAHTDPNSPIYGMPILNANLADKIVVIKRGQGVGFTEIENSLFHADNTCMLYGDAQKKTAELLQQVESL